MATTPPPPAQQPTQPPAPATPSSQSPTTHHTPNPPWLKYSAMAAVVLGPMALFLPPRRVGLQAMAISGGTAFAIDILAYEYTGESMRQRMARRFRAVADAGMGELPEPARRTQELLRQERERRRQLEQSHQQQQQEVEVDWREQRRRREREALAEGKGYGDLIVEHVKEAFGAKKKEEEAKSEDEEKK